jgi:hypothetical protein
MTYWHAVQRRPTTINFNVMLECGHRLQSDELDLSHQTKMMTNFLIDEQMSKKNDGKIVPSFDIYCPNCKQNRKFKFDSFAINWDHHLELI